MKQATPDVITFLLKEGNVSVLEKFSDKNFFENFKPKIVFAQLWKKLITFSEYPTDVREVFNSLEFLENKNIKIPKKFLKNKGIKNVVISWFKREIDDCINDKKYTLEKVFYNFRKWISYPEQRKIVKNFCYAMLGKKSLDIYGICRYMEIFEFDGAELKKVKALLKKNIYMFSKNRIQLIQILNSKKESGINIYFLILFREILNKYAIENYQEIMFIKEFSEPQLEDALFMAVTKKTLEKCLKVLLKNQKQEVDLEKIQKICVLRNISPSNFLKININITKESNNDWV